MNDALVGERRYRAAADLRAGIRRFEHITEQITRGCGLTPTRYELLLFVQAATDSGALPTVTSLCEPLQTSQGSVTQLVDGVVRAGLLERRLVRSDRRSSSLHLSAAGLERLRIAHDALGSERERLAEILGRRHRPGDRATASVARQQQISPSS